jgi:hypothetical protein
VARLAEERGLLVTGTSPPNSLVVPKTCAEGSGSGSWAGSTPKMPHSSSSQARRWMSKSSVREALVKSVAWRPVSLWSSQESMVPKTAPDAPSTFCSSHSILVPEK